MKKPYFFLPVLAFIFACNFLYSQSKGDHAVGLDIVLYSNSGKTSVCLFKNSMKTWYQKGNVMSVAVGSSGRKILPIRIAAGDEKTAGTMAKQKCRAGDPIPGIDVQLVKIPEGTTYSASTNGQGFIEIDDKLASGKYELRNICKGKWINTNVAITINNDGSNGKAAILLEADLNGNGEKKSHYSRFINPAAHSVLKPLMPIFATCGNESDLAKNRAGKR
jgi:hypothetical protein